MKRKDIIPSKGKVESSVSILLGKKIRIRVSKDIFMKFNGLWYVIPKGFTSDGASIPWLLTFFIERMDVRIILFSILHDYIYRTQFLTRAMGDLIYKEGLKLTAGTLLSIYAYYPLRLFGWIAWKRNQKRLHKYSEAKQRMIEVICNNLSGDKIDK